MQKAVLTAPKMSCGHCKAAVESAAGGLAGVGEVSADPESKKIEITYDDSVVSLEEIREAIATAGYPAE